MPDVCVLLLPKAMSGTITSPELVEDTGQPQSSVKEDRAREERQHGPQEVRPAYSNADDTDDALVSAPLVGLELARTSLPRW